MNILINILTQNTRNTRKTQSEDPLPAKQVKDDEFRSGFVVSIEVRSCISQQCLYVIVVQYENNRFPYGSRIQNVHVKLFSGADSCHIQVLYVSPKSPAVPQVVLEAPTVPRMPQNQHDKLLITSGHLSVRVRPSVAQ